MKGVFALKQIFIHLFSLLTLLACKPRIQAASMSKGVIHNRNHWENPSSIPVCWANPRGEGVTTELKSDLMNAVNKEYSRTALVRFSGWNDCNEASDEFSIRVYLDNQRTDGASKLGKSNQRLANYDAATMFLGIQFASSAYFKTGLIAAVLHEFGHAVGLAHEALRTDSTCPLSGDQPLILEGLDYTYVGAFDEHSIMSYCNRFNQELSQGDIESINYLYSRVILKSAQIPTMGIATLNGVEPGASIVLDQNCQPLSPDCTWIFQQNGMIVSAKNPGLAISVSGTLKDGAFLVLENNCALESSNCKWQIKSDGMIVSALQPNLAISAHDGVLHHQYLRLSDSCSSADSACKWIKN